MLKYEHVSRSEDGRETRREVVSRVIESGRACRVTTTYETALPDIEYFYKCERHRVDGPAFIDLEGGYILFTISGIDHECTKEFCKAAGMSDEDTFMWVLRFGDDLPDTIEGFYGDDWESIPLDQL